MTVHRLKLKDLDSQFLESLKQQYQNEELEVEIRINADHGDCAGQIMDENLFWKIIGLFNWHKEGDDLAVMEPAIDFLSQCSVENIKIFHNILSEKLFQLDAERFAKNIGDYAYGKVRHFSADLFLYARCCVVANGRNFFEHVFSHPEDMPKDLTFQAILDLANYAFSRKTGFETTLIPEFNYETFSNLDGW